MIKLNEKRLIAVFLWFFLNSKQLMRRQISAAGKGYKKADRIFFKLNMAVFSFIVIFLSAMGLDY